jgi:hypothetical protein
LLQTPNGWFFVSLRSLNVSEGYLGRIVAGKLVDFDALTELNFGRSDPVLTLLGEDDQVIATFFQPNANNLQSPITPDPEYVGVARRGQTVVASVLVDGKNVRTEYAPVGFGSGSRGVFAVSLTKDPGSKPTGPTHRRPCDCGSRIITAGFEIGVYGHADDHKADPAP